MVYSSHSSLWMLFLQMPLLMKIGQHLVILSNKWMDQECRTTLDMALGYANWLCDYLSNVSLPVYTEVPCLILSATAFAVFPVGSGTYLWDEWMNKSKIQSITLHRVRFCLSVKAQLKGSFPCNLAALWPLLVFSTHSICPVPANSVPISKIQDGA